MVKRTRMVKNQNSGTKSHAPRWEYHIFTRVDLDSDRKQFARKMELERINRERFYVYYIPNI